MISPAQLANRRGMATRVIQDTFPTVIAIGEHTNIPAARFSASRGGKTEDDALVLPVADIAVRVVLSEISSRGIQLIQEKTIFTESGVRYVLARIRDAKGDPAIVLEGRAA